MNKKCFRMIPLFMALLAMTACSSDDDPAGNGTTGNLVFDCTVSEAIAEVVTRATTGYQLPADLVPNSGDLKIALTGKYTIKEVEYDYSSQWEKLSAFHEEKPDLNVGTYKVVFTYGDNTKEGVGFPYYYGEVSGVDVEGNTLMSYGATVKLANSCFTLAATEWLLSYYKDVKLIIHTATSEFNFEPTDTGASELYFVKAGQQLYLSGSAVKSQTGTSVEFPKTAITSSNLAGETKYTITVNHGTAGGGELGIIFSDEFTEVPAIDIELNPDYDE